MRPMLTQQRLNLSSSCGSPQLLLVGAVVRYQRVRHSRLASSSMREDIFPCHRHRRGPLVASIRWCDLRSAQGEGKVVAEHELAVSRRECDEAGPTYNRSKRTNTFTM